MDCSAELIFEQTNNRSENPDANEIHELQQWKLLVSYLFFFKLKKDKIEGGNVKQKVEYCQVLYAYESSGKTQTADACEHRRLAVCWPRSLRR